MIDDFIATFLFIEKVKAFTYIKSVANDGEVIKGTEKHYLFRREEDNMMKRKLLALILAMVMMIASTSVVQAADDSMHTEGGTTTIGKGKYTVYAYTMSLGYVGEALIELSKITYVSGATTDEKQAIYDYQEKLKITNGVMTRFSISSFSDEIPDKTVTLASGKTSGICKSQSPSGAYVIYAASTNSLGCYGGAWSRNTYHNNFPLNLFNEAEAETEY